MLALSVFGNAITKKAEIIKNELETNIGTIQWASMKIPMRMLPKSAPVLPNILPIDVAMPLYSVENNSTIMQYVKLIPILEKASNIEANTIFSTEEVIKYNHAAEILDPKKLKTVKNLSPSLLINSGTTRLVGMEAIPMIMMFTYTEWSI